MTKRKKIGRPPLPPSQKCSERFTIRCTKAEKRRIEAEARRIGISPSQLFMKPWRGNTNERN